jgi:hypothetical protein
MPTADLPQCEMQDCLSPPKDTYQRQTAFETIRGPACGRVYRLLLFEFYFREQEPRRSIMLKTTAITHPTNCLGSD